MQRGVTIVGDLVFRCGVSLVLRFSFLFLFQHLRRWLFDVLTVNNVA